MCNMIMMYLKLNTKLWILAHCLTYVPCFCCGGFSFRNKYQVSDNIIISNSSAKDFNEQAMDPASPNPLSQETELLIFKLLVQDLFCLLKKGMESTV